MKKMINRENIEGKLFAHSLELKTVQNSKSPNFGKPFIQGNVEIQVDDDGLNVVSVHYSYIPEFTKNGKADRRFKVLSQIIESGKTVTTDGDDAWVIQATPSIALNDYYDINDEELKSYVSNDGGFLNIIKASDLKENPAARSTFEVDAVITKVVEVEPDEERDIPGYAEVNAGIFDFRNALMPVKFRAYNKNAIDYFLGLEASSSSPVFTKIWGEVRAKTFKRTVTEESAFGEASVREVNRTVREYAITGANKEPYDLGDDNILTADELKKAIQDRQVYLETVKSDRLKYEEERKNSNNAISTPEVKSDTNFNF